MPMAVAVLPVAMAAMISDIEAPFRECRYAARESMVIPCGIESPFSFPLAEKKRAIHGQKKRR